MFTIANFIFICKIEKNGYTNAMRKDALKNNKKIVDVIHRLYANQDITQYSMKKIAFEANVGIGTLYRNFPNKDYLLSRLVEDKMEELISKEYLFIENSEINEASFDHFLRSYIDFREENRTILSKIENPSKQLNNFYQSSLYENLVKLINKILTPLIPKTSSQEITFRSDMLIAMLNSNIFSFQRNERKLSTQIIFDNIKVIIFR